MLFAYPHRHGPEDADDALAQAVWIDLLDPTDEEIARVEQATGLRTPTRLAISEIEASSRLQREGGALYLSAPLVAGADTDAFALSPAGFVLNARHLLTVRFDRFSAFDSAAAIAARDGASLTSLGAFTCLFESIVDHTADLLERSAAELDQASHAVFRNEAKRSAGQANAFQRATLTTVGRLGSRLSQIRDALLGVGRIAPYVMSVHDFPIPPEIDGRLAALRHDIASLNDYEAHLANKVQFLLDAVLGFINISQNDIFKVLTVVSVVGIPPTLMAGIYGMNFKLMPELQWTLGYPFGLAMILLSALLPLAWFKWKDWL
jgi:magnesium transporter